jgi:hypothetical protein
VSARLTATTGCPLLIVPAQFALATDVLVELEHGRPRAGQTSGRRMGAQRRVHDLRRPARWQQQPRRRAGRKPIDQELGGDQSHAMRIRKDQRSRRVTLQQIVCHIRQHDPERSEVRAGESIAYPRH